MELKNKILSLIQDYEDRLDNLRQLRVSTDDLQIKDDLDVEINYTEVFIRELSRL